MLAIFPVLLRRAGEEGKGAGHTAFAFFRKEFYIRLQAGKSTSARKQVMRNLFVESAEKRTFHLREGSAELGTLTYTDWFSFKADIHIKNGAAYAILPKGFWGTTIEVKQNENVLLSFRMHWNGNIIIDDQHTDHPKDYVFKMKGFLKSAYVLQDKDGVELLAVQPDFSWSKLHYNHRVETADTYGDTEFDNLLVLVTIHCTNYYMTMMTTAAV